MLVEDEERVRAGLARALRRKHFEVIEAQDGVDALEQVSDWSQVDALISDCRMPRMTGLELQRCVLERRPELPILLLSGDPDSASDAAVVAPRCTFAQKPVTIEAVVGWLHGESAEL